MLGFGTLMVLAGSMPRSAKAQDPYPERPITLVVPFPAGGSTDLLARLVAKAMSRHLDQQIVVENRGGAGGTIGSAAVATAAPDGYTILMATVATHALNPALYQKLAYDPIEDFAPISLLAIFPNVLVTHPELPAGNVQELIDLLKASPGKYSYASAGNGTPSHLSAELFKSMAGVDMTHVPYQGAGPALIDVLSGDVPIMFDNLPPALEHVRAGTLHGLGVTTKQRASAIMELPTVAETLPGFETYSWNALFAPAGTPEPIIRRLHDAALAAVEDPETTARLEELSITPVGSTPEELAAHVEAELAKWAPVIKASGAQLD
ncbi:Bug family tripartite tricarboxylate transporter substrate binding protein [Geminicoccus roseus]|uniref:Bug family tripartite tricarboxylate transporter substrate binding protein n=1 Tax=Geminicoccus roseus TaxID=404900 RepID=UPI0003F9EE52|nr:tripartite tricarboxylate transporter substrate binding protein [Geminicoccus roseus]